MRFELDFLQLGETEQQFFHPDAVESHHCLGVILYRLVARSPSLTEPGVPHAVARFELEYLGAGRKDCRLVPCGNGAGDVLFAGQRAGHSYQLFGDIAQEPRRFVNQVTTRQITPESPQQIHLLLCPCHAHVAQPPFLFHLGGVVNDLMSSSTSSIPTINTAGNSSPFAWCSVISVTASTLPSRLSTSFSACKKADSPVAVVRYIPSPPCVIPGCSPSVPRLPYRWLKIACSRSVR